MAADLTLDTFRAVLDTAFRVATPDGPLELRLAKITDGGSAHGVEQFSLFFHGPGDRVLQQGTYAFDHDTLGRVLLFVVPVLGSTREQRVYEAAFTRLAQ